MAFLLDTNIAIHLRDHDAAVVDKVEELDGAILMSVITRVELEGGVYNDPAQTPIRRQRVDEMLQSITIVPFDDTAADAYRRIIEAAGFSRRKIIDRMIAAQALAHRATLVTINAADFRDVPGLDLLAW